VFLHKITSFAKDVFLPSVCCGCGTLWADALCPRCLDRIEKHTGGLCNRCGMPFDEKVFTGKGCTYCRQRELHFFRLRSYGPYKGILKEAIAAYAFRGVGMLRDLFASFFAELSQRHYGREKIDMIETVPSFLKNGRQDPSFEANHMQKIAAKLSIYLDLPYGDNMIKMRETLSQKEWAPLQGKAHADGCFKVKDRLHVQGKNILVIDDVFKSPARLNALSFSLKRSGADKIFLLTLARAL
jgi:competence protein ComFC